jgi:hypothetical protein
LNREIRELREQFSPFSRKLSGFAYFAYFAVPSVIYIGMVFEPPYLTALDDAGCEARLAASRLGIGTRAPHNGSRARLLQGQNLALVVKFERD